jgi:hypothetical protein
MLDMSVNDTRRCRQRFVAPMLCWWLSSDLPLSYGVLLQHWGMLQSLSNLFLNATIQEKYYGTGLAID